MILAGIDIGTNTLRLLIADIGPGSFREIHSDRQITRLGQHLDRTGVLSAEAQQRSLAALASFARDIERHKVEGVSAVGTSALRNAANSSEFISAVKAKTGLELRVIPGEEEARLTVLGVSRALWPRADALPGALVVDIGGGSTEIIDTGPGQPSERSLPLGAVYLTERFIHHDPPVQGELDAIRNAVAAELKSSFPAPVSDQGRTLSGTAGTITTLAAIEQNLAEYDPARINGFVLTAKAIGRIIAKLAASRLSERRKIKGLEPGREDIVLAGALICEEIMKHFAFSSMLVSDWGLREGILFALYEETLKRLGGKEG